jgi:type VI secretion system protein ImpL
VYPFYNQNLKGRYPIARSATLDVNLEDFKAFFSPDNGVFSSFLNTKLAPFLRPVDEGFALASWNGIRLPMNPGALAALGQTQKVGRRVIGDVPGSYKVYSLNLTLPATPNTTRITLRLGEEQLSVAKGEGQARQTLRWPSQSSYKGAELTVETPGGAPQSRRADGAFGLLKLLEGARAYGPRPGGFSAKWRFTVAQKYDVDAALDANIPDRENPFSTPEFFRFELPPKLMSGSTAATVASGGM